MAVWVTVTVGEGSAVVTAHPVPSANVNVNVNVRVTGGDQDPRLIASPTSSATGLRAFAETWRTWLAVAYFAFPAIVMEPPGPLALTARTEMVNVLPFWALRVRVGRVVLTHAPELTRYS